MPNHQSSTIPAERAFVVQLRADADFGSGAVTGRIEHVSSGTAGCSIRSSS